MGKSKKRGRDRKPPLRKNSAKGKQGRSWSWMVAFGLAVVGFGGGYSLYQFARADRVSPAAAARKPARPWKMVERNPVLPADYFVGTVREAYTAAARIPEVLDQLYCYCRCKEQHGHKTLLTCFTVIHASQCEVCVVETLFATRLYEKGYSPEAIQKAIDRKFG